MNEQWIEESFYKALAIGLLALWAIIGISGHFKEQSLIQALSEQEAACAAAERDYKGNSLCYIDSSCMITGEDFRLQLHTDAYLEEYCPDEWEASKEPTKATRSEEADPGLSVWSGGTETSRW